MSGPGQGFWSDYIRLLIKLNVEYEVLDRLYFFFILKNFFIILAY